MGKFNFKDEQDFTTVKQEAEVFYGTIRKVHCPYFKEDVPFNTRGLKHLKFKSDQQARPRGDQYTRLKLIHLAPEVLRLSHTVQGIWRTKKFELSNINSRWDKLLREIVFYEFIAVLDGVRIKVIVKEVEGGEKHFWSVIPYWNIDVKNGRRILHSGNPDQD